MGHAACKANAVRDLGRGSDAGNIACTARRAEVAMIVSEARVFTYGLALGGALVFLLDPRRGAARRAVIRDKSLRAIREIEQAAQVGSRDMTHRLEGAVARVHVRRGREPVDDDVLVSRVRAKLGHVCSHPHAIAVNAKGGGCIELKGPILSKEASQVVSAISRVPGVTVLDDDLERHAHADVPALQGMPVRRSPLARAWTPAVRLVLGVGAGVVALASLLQGKPLGLILGGAGVLGLARTSTRGHGNAFAGRSHRAASHASLEGVRGDGNALPGEGSRLPMMSL
jgi:hypothetical protein